MTRVASEGCRMRVGRSARAAHRQVPFEDVCLLELRELYNAYAGRVKYLGFLSGELWDNWKVQVTYQVVKLVFTLSAAPFFINSNSNKWPGSCRNIGHLSGIATHFFRSGGNR